MTDISTLSSFIIVAFVDAGCWTGMHLRQAEIVAGGKEESKQGWDVDLDGPYTYIWAGQVSWCLLLNLTSRNVPPYPICHVQSKLSLSIYILLVQSHILHRILGFPRRSINYSESSCTMGNRSASPPQPHRYTYRKQMEIKD